MLVCESIPSFLTVLPSPISASLPFVKLGFLAGMLLVPALTREGETAGSAVSSSEDNSLKKYPTADL